MKRKLQIFTGASVASLLAFAVMAQDTSNPNPGVPNSALQRPARTIHDAGAGLAEKASDIRGMEVKNYENEKLGKVADLAVDLESGRIVQVILSAGGILGVGDSHFAVPPGSLHCDIPNKVIHLKADTQKLKAAPKFEMSRWEEATQPNQVTETYRYTGEQPFFASAQNADKSAKGPGHLGYVQRASKLMGTAVKNLQDEKLGKVENFMVDLPAGRILVVVVSSGGFLGLGDELSAVPPTALHYNTELSTLLLDSTKDALTKAPHFKAGQWPEVGQPAYAEGVYRAYRVEPYFSTNAVVDANNSGRNVRDRNNQTLTPLDQGNSKADVDTTAQIRKEIIAGKDMSVSARNVKIITVEGRVTLRGPVNTTDEKRLIGEIAARIAGSEKVDNQLEVKLTPTGRN